MVYHNPVLLRESVDGLNIHENGIYVDVTFGGGGHSGEILKRFKNGRLIAFDQDKDAEKNTLKDERFLLVNQNFKYLRNYLKLHNALPINGLLADLGVSSHQFDSLERGFSFRADAVLDMRMDKKNEVRAMDILNTYSQEKLKALFKDYGEIYNAGLLTSLILKARDEKKIKNTRQLVDIVSSCVNKKHENKYLAQVFQALRIEVNGELEALKELLNQCDEVLVKGGRLVVISYHSLEDRLVKNFTKTGNFEGEVKKDFYGNVLRPFEPISNKVIVPSEIETKQNNRARSAKMRIATKC